MSKITVTRKKLEELLEDLEKRSDIMASALVTRDGLVMASALPKEIDEDAISAMAGMMLGLGNRVGIVLKRGAAEQVIINGKEGYAILTECGPAVLIGLAPSDAKLGILLYEMKDTANAIKNIMMK
ncbi:MAG: roadblock/LC7 domain-containing protein [Candidatus Baldrarchaeia archaeon]